MDSEKSINSFKMKERIRHLIIYRIIFVGDLLITFWHYYYAKYMFLTFLMWLVFSRFLLSREVLKF